jgi:elongation factor P--beta-lysine ligase
LHELKLNQGLVSKYKEIDFTKQEWYRNYQDTYNKMDEENKFKEIQQQLSEKIPNTIEKILSGDTITFTDLQDAFYFKFASILNL